MMKHNGVPEDTVYRLIGGSVWLRIPPKRLSHLEIEHIKNEDTSSTLPAKHLSEESEDGEKHGSHWYPHAESQQGEEQ